MQENKKDLNKIPGVTDKRSEESKQQNAEKQAKREARNKAWKEAFVTLKELVDKQQDKKYQEALKFLRPSLYGVTRSGGGGSSLMKEVINFIKEKTTVDEVELFKQFKVGRKDVATYIKRDLRKSAPEDRVWIAFDAATGIYKVAGKGAKEPQNWTGYKPVKESIQLK